MTINNYVETELYGLVLAGGKSQRMGHDKSRIVYHQKEQLIHTAELLQKFCKSVFISRRKKHQAQEGGFEVIEDIVNDRGPLGAIHSAFSYKPGIAFLVLACDLPLMDENTIQLLVNARDIHKMATCLKSPENDFPEPLVAIYEAQIAGSVKEYIDMNYACPRKVLLNNPVKIVELENSDVLMNANTVEQKNKAREILGSK